MKRFRSSRHWSVSRNLIIDKLKLIATSVNRNLVIRWSEGARVLLARFKYQASRLDRTRHNRLVRPPTPAPTLAKKVAGMIQGNLFLGTRKCLSPAPWARLAVAKFFASSNTTNMTCGPPSPTANWRWTWRFGGGISSVFCKKFGGLNARLYQPFFWICRHKRSISNRKPGAARSRCSSR